MMKRRQIEHLWDRGLNTHEVGLRVGIPEHRVAHFVSGYVTTKRFRKSAF